MSMGNLPPTTRLILIGFAGLAVALAAIWLSLAPPHLGVKLAVGDDGSARIVAVDPGGPSAAAPTGRLSRVGGSPIVGEDLVEEPDYLPDYAATDRLFQRQARLSQELEGDAVRLEIVGDDGRTVTVAVTPGQRTLADLPAPFWFQLVVGLGCFFVGGWIWTLRSRDLAAAAFGVSGVGMLTSSVAAAIYSTRELALDGTLFRVLSGFNHTGAMAFGAAMITLFLVYPRPMGPKALLLAPTLVFGLWLILDLAHVVPNVNLGLSGAVAVEMALIVVAIVAQWFANRKDPVGRTLLRWLGLSVIVGGGGFILGTVAPQLLGQKPIIDQAYGFGFFLLIYVSLAVGLRRHRLFELDDWAFRIAFYALAALCFAALDATLAYMLHFTPAAALSLSLAAVAFLYLPLRDVLWRRIVSRPSLSDEDLFGVVVDAALAPDASARSQRWRGLVERLFDPLEVAPAGREVTQAEIQENGLELLLPPTASSGALSLRMPWRGRGLFNSSHQKLAQRAQQLMERIEAGREAYERGRTEERRRIASDLHDDVGALLLSGLHRTDLGATRQAIREAITDIGAIVDGLTGERQALVDLVADLRFETAQRLEDAGLTLDWPLPDGLEGEVDPVVCKHIRSAVREVVSNAIRHAEARRLEVQIETSGGRLAICLADDGKGMPPDRVGHGHGVAGLTRRLASIGGAAAFPPVARGVKVELSFSI